VSLRNIFQTIQGSKQASTLRLWAKGEPGAARSVELIEAGGSTLAFYLSDLVRAGSSLFCVLPDHDRAAYLHSDIQQVLRGDDLVQLLPPSDHRPFDPEHVADPAPAIQRADVLARLQENQPGIVVSGIEAFLEKVLEAETLSQSTIVLNVGDSTPPQAVIEDLISSGFDGA